MRAAAVEQGADATRLVVPGPDGRPEPVAVLPSGTTVATALDELLGPSPGPIVLVHPPDRDGPAAGFPRVVHPVPAPVAVVAGRPGAYLVVDAGRSGTTLTVVDDGCVRSTVRVPVGGDRLDARLAAATGCPPDRVRGAREALSFADRVDVPGHGPLDAATVAVVLRPEFDDVAARVPELAAGVKEIVLAGGLGRAPLLAEVLDECAGRPVRVLPEPDSAAVRGALEVLRSAEAETGVGGPPGVDPEAPDPWVAAPGAAGRGSGAPAGDSDGAGPADGASALGRSSSSAPRARRGRLLPAAVLGVLLVGTGSVLGAAVPPPAPPPGTLVQYGYSVALPAGWQHAGGDPRHRRTLLTRVTSPDGVELVSVERSPLGYDSAAEPDRARAELTVAHRAAGDLGELRPDTVAGRTVTRYLQQAGPDAAVDWFVLFDGTDELAVGCRHPPRGRAPELERACAEVVGSVRMHP